MAEGKKARSRRSGIIQSRYGCSMCKMRRIKCDESIPSCRRCLVSNRICPGYDGQDSKFAAIEQSSSCMGTSSVHLLQRFSFGNGSLQSCHYGSEDINQPYYVLLACQVFSEARCGAQNAVEKAFWNCDIPQMAHSSALVNIAATVFGAAYDEVLHQENRHRSNIPAIFYSKALQLLRNTLFDPKQHELPSLIACLLLACAAILQRQPRSALIHLKGCFAVMDNLDESHKQFSILSSEIRFFFAKLDLQIATYALGHGPELVAGFYDKSLLNGSSSLDHELCVILDSCYRFTAAVMDCQRHSDTFSRSWCIEQGRLLGSLRRWLHLCDKERAVSLNESASHFLLVLRAQCIAAMIHLSAILESNEMVYDDYALLFQSIITSAERILSYQRRQAGQLRTQHNTPFLSFSPEMGIIQPLFFASVKYRDRMWRRHAIKLLRQFEKEGPWDGQMEACIASTALCVEEGLSFEEIAKLINNRDSPTMLTPIRLLTHQRLHRLSLIRVFERMSNEVSDNSASVTRFAVIQLERRNREGDRNSEEDGKDLLQTRQHSNRWKIWTETIPLY